MGYLQEAFVVFVNERFSYKIKEQMKSPRKVYAYDTGTIHAVKVKITPDIGKLMENAVAVELRRRGKEFYYYKTRDGKEVDFAVKEGVNINQLLQVCYEVGDDKMRKRETNALIKATSEVGCNNLTVLTWDYEAREPSGKRTIIYLPLWKWLIGQE
jgi:predicted AAA+ superfamily ATPase